MLGGTSLILYDPIDYDRIPDLDRACHASLALCNGHVYTGAGLLDSVGVCFSSSLQPTCEPRFMRIVKRTVSKLRSPFSLPWRWGSFLTAPPCVPNHLSRCSLTGTTWSTASARTAHEELKQCVIAYYGLSDSDPQYATNMLGNREACVARESQSHGDGRSSRCRGCS